MLADISKKAGAVESEKTTSDAAYIQFGEWLRGQPYWLQDAAWRIYNGKEIDADQIEVYASMCVTQAKKKVPAYNHLNEGEAAQKKRSEKVSVLSMSDIVGVNALTDKARLDFSVDGVSVIYGLNGAGKSGFMRIFKELSGSPYEEPIQPNVYKKAVSATASCRVVVMQDGEQKEATYNLSGKQKTSLLSVCDVFDTRISSAYIAATNNVSYQPFVFTVLTELAGVADRVSKHLEVQKKAIAEKSIDLPDEFASFECAKWIRDIACETVIPPECLVWNEEKHSKLTEIPKLLDTERVKEKLDVVATNLRVLAPILTDLQAANIACDQQKISEAYQQYVTAKKELDAAQKLFGENADEYDKISIDSKDWKSLWNTAKVYYEAVLFENGGPHFSENGSICPLCHQIINDNVQKRFANVNEYINGTCNINFANARKAFESICENLYTRTYSEAQVKHTFEGILTEKELTSIIAVYKALGDLKSADNIDTCYTIAGSVVLKDAISILSKIKDTYDAEKGNLTNALNDEKKAELKMQFDMLKFQKWAFDNRQIIQRVISNLCSIADLNNAKQYLTTNKITAEANKLAEVLITAAYIERFTSELSKLAPGIKVKLEKAPSQKGNSPYKVSIDTDSGKKCKPGDILSEGEQRIVALAAFFADATGRDELTPIIIDDPISSLDLNYEESATKRIIELAKCRQVIVFTHRISLLVGISDACETNGVLLKENHIRSGIKGKGLPDFEDLYHGKLVSQLNGLRNKISQIKKKDTDSEEYRDALERICQQFRICVERSVEDELLLGMVHRFKRRIMTSGIIMKMPNIAVEDCRMVDDMMSKYSFVEHSQPTDSQLVQFSIDEIDKDIELYVKWITDYRKKMKK